MNRAAIAIGCLMSSMLSANSETKIQLYRPFTETTNHKPLVAVKKMTGECFAASEHAKREDAWRCKSEGQLYDPCFSQPHRLQNFVLCPQSPWTGRSIKVVLASPVKKNEQALDISKELPWALQLSNGQKCLAIDSTQQIDGLDVHFQCNQNTLLVGHLQRCKPVWSVVSFNNQSGLKTVDIKQAWF